jgi:hypothetical protein
MSRETNDRTKPSGLGEFLFNELRQAFQDIRQKVVEQGWFGRVTTPKPVVEMPFSTTADKTTDGSDLLHERPQSFEQSWAIREPDARDRNHPEIDFER